MITFELLSIHFHPSSLGCPSPNQRVCPKTGPNFTVTLLWGAVESCIFSQPKYQVGFNGTTDPTNIHYPINLHEYPKDIPCRVTSQVSISSVSFLVFSHGPFFRAVFPQDLWNTLMWAIIYWLARVILFWLSHRRSGARVRCRTWQWNTHWKRWSSN